MNPIDRRSLSATAAVAAACAVTTSSTGETVEVQSNLIEPTTSAQMVVLVNPELHRPETSLLWSTAPAGPHSATLDVVSPDALVSYFAVGLTSNQGVFVTFADPTAALGISFATLFPGFVQSDVAGMLATNDPALDGFISSVALINGVATSFGQSSAAVRFSPGQSLGALTATLAQVPAPGGVFLIFGTGALVAASRRRRSPCAA